MEMMNNYGVLSIIAVSLGLVARYFIGQLWHTTQPGARMGAMAGLLAVYTAALLLVLGQIYQYILDTDGTIQSYHHMAMLSILMVNTIVLFVSIFFCIIRGKRRLSNTDKMKLMDL
ncbi:MAG: hypothetical protein NC400_05825 [Clostridium sp.]|nr:hypothetical protein [Clostridium sp.]